MVVRSSHLEIKTLRMLLVVSKRTLLPSNRLDYEPVLILGSTTKNPNVSQEAKENAEQRLKDMGQ